MDEDEIRGKIKEMMENMDLQVIPMDDASYIDYLVNKIWMQLPTDIMIPSVVDILEDIVTSRIERSKFLYLRELGLVEDEKEEKPEECYILNIDINDPGTVVGHQGAGPRYLDVIRALAEAVGEIVFYSRWDSLSGPKGEAFNVNIRIYDETEEDPDDREIFGRNEEHLEISEVVDVLVVTRKFIRDYREAKEKGKDKTDMSDMFDYYEQKLEHDKP